MGHKTNCKIFLSRQIQIAANCCSNSTVFLPTATTTTTPTEREHAQQRQPFLQKLSKLCRLTERETEREKE